MNGYELASIVAATGVGLAWPCFFIGVIWIIRKEIDQIGEEMDRWCR